MVIPEVDRFTYSVMCSKVGHKPDAKALTASNIYAEILAASEALDNAEVPETVRVLVVTPSVYVLMKQSTDIVMETDVGQEMRLKGVIATLGAIRVDEQQAKLDELERLIILTCTLLEFSTVSASFSCIWNPVSGK